MSFTFYKRNTQDRVWWVRLPGQKDPLLFSFDRKKIFNYWTDYPLHLSEEQKKLFDEENPFWAGFYRDDVPFSGSGGDEGDGNELLPRIIGCEVRKII